MDQDRHRRDRTAHPGDPAGVVGGYRRAGDRFLAAAGLARAVFHTGIPDAGVGQHRPAVFADLFQRTVYLFGDGVYFE